MRMMMIEFDVLYLFVDIQSVVEQEKHKKNKVIFIYIKIQSICGKSKDFYTEQDSH